MLNEVYYLPELISEQIPKLDKEVKSILNHREITSIKEIIFTGCGDSYFAGLGARHFFQRVCNISTRAIQSMDASRYDLVDYNSAFPGNPLVMATSVSGKVVKVDQFMDSSGYRRMAVQIQVEGDEWMEGIDRTETLVKEFDYSTEQIRKKILEAGRVAPTGCNNQPQCILVVQKEDGLAKLKKATNVYGAPLALIVCGDKRDAWNRPFDGKNIIEIDISIVTDHMMLQATELGLGSIWICYFKPDVIKAEFNLPEGLEPINILGIGYAGGAEQSPERHGNLRKQLSETVVYESF